jgi:hypothetical protein
MVTKVTVNSEDYDESNVRVRSFDNVLQAMHRNKIKANTSGLFWGKPYEILIEKRLTGTPDCEAIPYRAPGIKPVVEDHRCAHYQYNTLVIVKVQVAERGRTTTKAKRAKPVNLYEIKSSPSVES